MRNLKKILALVLALVMSLSLMATASAKTNFPDDGEITDIYRPAVEVLSGLNVFVGDQNGEFNPGDHIRRSEVAAIIYRIATGDVTNSQNDAYTPYNQFSDVIAGDWFAGYVTYCANAGYIKGRNDGKFDPYAEVTGYEVLAMILRAVGYDKNNEFVGSNWQLNTASIAQQKGVLGNITSTTKLSEAATRETVAELLFQSMLLPQVTWNAATLSYDANRPTLAKEHLDTEEVTGVVVANEYANLYDYSTLADGKTDLEVAEGDVRRLDWNDGDFAEGIKVIGKSRHAYIQNAKVLYMTDTDMNDVKDNDGAETTVNALRGGLDISNAEYYLNFDPSTQLYCERRIEFNLRFTSADLTDTTTGLRKFIDVTKVTKETLDTYMDRDTEAETGDVVLAYEKVIPANEPISGSELRIMEAIFKVASDVKQTWGIDGSVYVGTRSGAADILSNDKDVSNDISYATFEEEYILTKNDPITEAGNGEWLQVIDNDGDGKAEYVMLLGYDLDRVMAEVKDGFYYYWLNTDWYTPTYLNGYTPAVGDYVLYARIDGKAQMHKAETATATFRAVNYKERQATDTDSTTWEQSDIWNHTELNEVLTDVNENVEYTLYLDEYGYVRATNNKSNYALVTEIYPTNNMNQAWLQTYDLTAEVMLAGDSSVKEYRMLNSYPNGTWNPFVVRDYDNNGSLDSWKPPILSNTFTNPNYNNQPNYLQPATHMLGVDRHEAADMFRYAADSEQRTHSWTNVAEYSLGENGINLFTAANFDGYYDNGAIVAGTNYKDYVQLKVQDVATNTKSLYLIEGDYSNSGTSAAHGGSYVRAVDDTIFYVVARDGGIHQYSLATLPSLTMETHNIHAMYAVASPLTTNDNYSDGSWVADVIVIEVEHDVAASWTSIGLIYSNNTKESTVVKCLEVLDSKLGYIQIVPTNVNIWNGQFTNYGFYKLYNVSDPDENGIRTAAIEKINNNENFNSYGIYYGRVRSQQAEMDRSKYITVEILDQENKCVDNTSIRLAADYGQAWAIDAHRNYNDAFTLALGSYGNNRVCRGDEIIWVESGAGTAGFIVDLTDTDWDFGVAYNRGYTTPGFLGNYESGNYGDWYNIAASQWTYSGDIDAAYTYEEIVYPITSSTTRASMPAYRNFVLTSYDLYVNGSPTAAEPVYSGVIDNCWHIRYNLQSNASVKVVVTPNTRVSLKLNADFTTDYEGVLQPVGNTWNFTMPNLTPGEKVVGTIRDTADPVKTPVEPGANEETFETGEITTEEPTPETVEVSVNEAGKSFLVITDPNTLTILKDQTVAIEDLPGYLTVPAEATVSVKRDGAPVTTGDLAEGDKVVVTTKDGAVRTFDVKQATEELQNYKVTFQYTAEQADVTVDGYTDLTKIEVPEGTKLTFTVAEKEGYEIVSVKDGTTVLSPNATTGKYEITVTAETTITVETKGTGTVEPPADIFDANITEQPNEDNSRTGTATINWYDKDIAADAYPDAAFVKAKMADQGVTLTTCTVASDGTVTAYAGEDQWTITLNRYYKVTIGAHEGYAKKDARSLAVDGVVPGTYIVKGKVAVLSTATTDFTTVATAGIVRIPGAGLTADMEFEASVPVVFGTSTVGAKVLGIAANGTPAGIPIDTNTEYYIVPDTTVSVVSNNNTTGTFHGLSVNGVLRGELADASTGANSTSVTTASISTGTVYYTYVVDPADVWTGDAAAGVAKGKITLNEIYGYKVMLGDTYLGLMTDTTNKKTVTVTEETSIDFDGTKFVPLTQSNTTACEIVTANVWTGTVSGDTVTISSTTALTNDMIKDGIVILDYGVSVKTTDTTAKISYDAYGVKVTAGAAAEISTAKYVARSAKVELEASAVGKYIQVKTVTGTNTASELRGTVGSAKATWTLNPAEMASGTVEVTEIDALTAVKIKLANFDGSSDYAVAVSNEDTATNKATLAIVSIVGGGFTGGNWTTGTELEADTEYTVTIKATVTPTAATLKDIVSDSVTLDAASSCALVTGKPIGVTHNDDGSVTITIVVSFSE